jgi:hypothetical protein
MGSALAHPKQDELSRAEPNRRSPLDPSLSPLALPPSDRVGGRTRHDAGPGARNLPQTRKLEVPNELGIANDTPCSSSCPSFLLALTLVSLFSPASESESESESASCRFFRSSPLALYAPVLTLRSPFLCVAWRGVAVGRLRSMPYSLYIVISSRASTFVGINKSGV